MIDEDEDFLDTLDDDTLQATLSEVRASIDVLRHDCPFFPGYVDLGGEG